jgi:hypothetical protein
MDQRRRLQAGEWVQLEAGAWLGDNNDEPSLQKVWTEVFFHVRDCAGNFGMHLQITEAATSQAEIHQPPSTIKGHVRLVAYTACCSLPMPVSICACATLLPIEHGTTNIHKFNTER